MKVRDRILETAARLFYRQGYNSTGINQIIGEAGIAKASLYQHFRSKEDLCLAYLEYRSGNWESDLKAELAGLQNAGPKEKIIAIFNAIEKIFIGSDFRGCTFQNIVSEAPADDRIFELVQKYKDKLRNFFKSWFDAEVQQNLIPADYPDLLFLLFEGAMIQSQIYKDTWPIQLAKNTLIARL